MFWTYTLITYDSGRSPSEPPSRAWPPEAGPDPDGGVRALLPVPVDRTGADPRPGRTARDGEGLVLVLLLGAIAGLVTRQVVTPVRLAAQIAERFSAGRLSERMVVKNRDDIGRLATSFNQMAGNLQRQIGQLEELSRSSSGSCRTSHTSCGPR